MNKIEQNWINYFIHFCLLPRHFVKHCRILYKTVKYRYFCRILSNTDKFRYILGNCDIDFFNFRHCQVWNFKISNLFERNWNFAVIFWKYWKRNWKSTKYFTTERKQSFIALKFCEILLVSFEMAAGWNGDRKWDIFDLSYWKMTRVGARFCEKNWN